MLFSLAARSCSWPKAPESKRVSRLSRRPTREGAAVGKDPPLLTGNDHLGGGEVLCLLESTGISTPAAFAAGFCGLVFGLAPPSLNNALSASETWRRSVSSIRFAMTRLRRGGEMPARTRPLDSSPPGVPSAGGGHMLRMGRAAARILAPRLCAPSAWVSTASPASREVDVRYGRGEVRKGRQRN